MDFVGAGYGVLVVAVQKLHLGEQDQSTRVAWISRSRLAQVDFGSSVVLLLHLLPGQVYKGWAKVGIRGNGFLKSFPLLIGISQTRVHNAQVVVGFGLGR